MALPIGIKVAGNVSPIATDFEVEITATNGTEYTTIYRGEASSLWNAFAGLAAGSSRSHFRKTGATAQAEITFKTVPGTGAEIPVDTVELSFNEIQKSIFFNPFYAGLSGTAIQDVQSAFDKIQSITGDEAADKAERAAVAALIALDSSVMAEALDSLLERNDTYLYFQPVIIYTRSVSAGFPTQLAINNVGTIFSTAALPIPGSLFSLFPIPDVSNSIAVRPGYALAWLKSAAVRVQSDGGAQLIQTFVYDAYRLTDYSGTHD